uniref:Putative regulator component n=1 Tax=Streptomyces sp. NRRL 30471 TaxID=996287 RepID=F2WUE7_9ACTN|nr:putative regulator component [Streptomyces sp. NRRL 30471]
MANDLAELGSRLGHFSLIVLWIAILLRSPSGIRSPHQRGLWLAAVFAATAMTLDLMATASFALHVSGLTHPVTLTKNLIGVLSAGAVLHFVAATFYGRRLRNGLCCSTGVVVAVLLALDLTAPRHPRHSVSGGAVAVPSLTYWLLLITTHLTANAVCFFMCWQYGRRTETRSLTIALRLFGMGTAFIGAFWFISLMNLWCDGKWSAPSMQLLMSLHSLFRAAAILVPTFLSIGHSASDIATAWRLWPLWHDLIRAVPHVALAKPRARLLELVWPQVPRDLLVYRRLIETRDAILALNEYVGPTVPRSARNYVRNRAVPPASVDATVLACVVRSSRNAKLAGRPPEKHQLDLFAIGGGDLEGEKAFLLQMARAYESDPVRRFDHSRPSVLPVDEP